MPWSSYQYCRKSLPETSARLPAEMKADSPAPLRWRPDRTAIPMAPDWVKSPMRPALGDSGAREALRRTVSEVLMMPKAFGPMMRMPYERACRTSSRCRSRPSAPRSAYPAVRTTSPCTPCSPQSATASGTRSAGTATTARSTCSPIPPTERWAGTPSTVSRPGGKDVFTAYVRPVKPEPRRLRSTVRPTPPGSRPTPMTATDPGASRRWTERASARCSRARWTARDSAVGSRSRVRWTEPSSKLRCWVKPASRNTLIILLLAGSTSAAKRRMPRSLATAAMCSRRADATPRPWWASWTRKATSASSAGADAGLPCSSIRSKRTVAMNSPPIVTARPTRST